MALAFAEHAPDLVAASDGDGDRNMIVGPGVMVSPGDSLAVLAANAGRIPGYRDGLRGIARSMPTSHAADLVAAKLGIPLHETPTGWRFFCNLLESGSITLCGEESFGTSSSHCREKDGLWAVLFWLNLIAVTGKSVPALLHEHWTEYGRTFFLRNDYRIMDATAAKRVVEELRESVGALPGRSLAGRRVIDADEFGYLDPVDGRRSERQGIRVMLDGRARIVFRLSGTDTAGATLRIYIEDHSNDPTRLHDDAGIALAELAEAARDLARVTPLTGLTGPTMAV
jgi:phosphoglucomutase